MKFDGCAAFPSLRRRSGHQFSRAFLAFLLAVGAWAWTLASPGPADPAGQRIHPSSSRTSQRPIPAALPATMAPSPSPRRRKKQDAPPPPPEPKVKNPPGLQNFSLRVDVPEVNLDVGVILQKTHEFVPNLQEANFRVYEDGVAQKVVGFQRTKAPITAVLLCEFASTNYCFVHDMSEAAYAFAQQLQPDDYIAVVTYDMHTQDPDRLYPGQAHGLSNPWTN